MTKLYERLALVVKYALPGLTALSSEEASRKPTPSKWSKKEILGHLNDSFINNARRLVLSYHQHDLIFEGYDADLWVDAQGYQSLAWGYVVQLWANGQSQMINLISNLPEDILLRETKVHEFDKMLMRKVISKGETGTLTFLIEDYIYHQEYHLNQVIGNYSFVQDLSTT